MTQAIADWRALAAELEGDLLVPDSDGYEAARRPAIARFRDARPAGIARCRTTGDVAAAIAFARRAGLPIAARSGGHCFAGRSSTDGLVVDVGPMDGVALDGDVAVVGAGARLGRIYDALDAHARTIPAGCGPRVGVAGLALGGGLGILGRRCGLLCDSLRGATVVLADGRVAECDEEREAELFWALRGAGAGGFGIVTALRIATLPAPAATRLRVVWPPDAAAAVIDAWQRWSPDAPDELAASVLVAAPADPAAPPTVTVAGAYIGADDEARGLVDALVARVGTAPSSILLVHASYRETKRALADTGGMDDPLEAAHVVSRSEFFARSVPVEAVAALAGHLAGDRRAGEARELDFTPMGGAYNRVAADATAFTHRDARFLLKHAVVTDLGAGEPQREAARNWVERSHALVHAHGTGGVYPNFPEEGLADWPRAYHGDNHDRLVAVKERYDPADVFRSAQSIRTRTTAASPNG